MKMSRFLTVMAVILVLVLGLSACEFPLVSSTTSNTVATEPTKTEPTPTTPTTTPTTNGGNPGVDPTPDHECESVCPECGLCLNDSCVDAVCADK